MTERQKLTGLTSAIKKAELPQFEWQKIYDTPRASHQKPYDVFGEYRGRGFRIEFKNEGNKLEPHQAEALAHAAQAGALTFVAEFVGGRSIEFKPFIETATRSFMLHYRKGYPDIKKLPEWLVGLYE